MKRISPFVLTCVWGSLCGGVLGALRTRQATLHLLAKNRALEAIGIPSLPGASHWGILDSLAPAGAGALFFGLSVGLGCGALAALWVVWASGPPAENGRRSVRWLCLAAPLWAAWSGDWGLGATLLALCVGACLTPAPGKSPPFLLIGVCACITVVGLLPFARAPEGPFSRLRDRVLLSNPAGLAVNAFYYRWTLYPAEVLKPFAARSQPSAALQVAPPPPAAADFCDAASRLRILCLPEATPGADFAVRWSPSGPVLAAGEERIPWPLEWADQTSAWQEFSRVTDRAASLRKVTAFALFTACPIGLVWALGSLCAWAGSRVLPRHPRAAAAALATLAALTLFAAGRPVSGLENLETPAPVDSGARRDRILRELASEEPARRLHAVRLAPVLGKSATPLLLRCLSDPVVNVRYAAAEALGTTGGASVEARLLEVLRGAEEWYVKERAYNALWRLGWRPQPL